MCEQKMFRSHWNSNAFFFVIHSSHQIVVTFAFNFAENYRRSAHIKSRKFLSYMNWIVLNSNYHVTGFFLVDFFQCLCLKWIQIKRFQHHFEFNCMRISATATTQQRKQTTRIPKYEKNMEKREKFTVVNTLHEIKF